MRFGVIYGRSWIGAALIERLGERAQVYPKDYQHVGFDEWLGLTALFLIAGRVRPDDVEKRRELDLIRRVSTDLPHSLRIIYLSSSEAARDSDYGRHKRACEDVLFESDRELVCVRPPAVYGPGQPLDSGMLVPSLAREGSHLGLSNPDEHREYVHVDDLVEHLIDVGTCGYSSNPLRGIWATARQMKQLWETWSLLRIAMTPDE